MGENALVFVKTDAFQLTSERDVVNIYKAEVPYLYTRCFCSKCGMPFGELTSDNDTFPVAANGFDVELNLGNRFHEFVKEKPHGYKTDDEAKNSGASAQLKTTTRTPCPETSE